MTSRSEQLLARTASARKPISSALSGLIGLSVLTGMAAIAEEGSGLPPPPALKGQVQDEHSKEFKPTPVDDGEPGRKPFIRPFPGGPGGPGGSEGMPPMFQRRMRRHINGEGPTPGMFMQRGGGMGPGAGMGMGMGMGRFGGRGRLDLTPLNLTEQQKEKIAQIRQGSRTRAKDLRRSLMQKQIELRKMMFSPEATTAEIRSSRKELRALQDQMDELALNDFLSIRDLLTAEQKQKLPSVAPTPGFGPAGGQALSGRQRRGE